MLATVTIRLPMDPTETTLIDVANWLRSLSTHEIKLVQCQISESFILILDVPYRVYKELEHQDCCTFIGLNFGTIQLPTGTDVISRDTENLETSKP